MDPEFTFLFWLVHYSYKTFIWVGWICKARLWCWLETDSPIIHLRPEDLQRVDTAEDGSNVVSIPDSRNIGRIRSLLVVESLSDHSLFRRVIQPCFFLLIRQSWNWILWTVLYILWCICLDCFFLFIGVLVSRSHMHALLTIAYVCFFASCLHGHWCAWDCLCVRVCMKSLVHWINLATCNHLPFKTSSLSPCALFLSSDCMCAWMRMCLSACLTASFHCSVNTPNNILTRSVTKVSSAHSLISPRPLASLTSLTPVCFTSQQRLLKLS